MQLNRRALQRLSRQRLRESKVLFQSGQWSGAYYLAGYALECALKARIAGRTRRHDFPLSPRVAARIHVHDLESLLIAAGLPAMPERLRETHWRTVLEWSVDSRYQESVDRIAARDLIQALVGKEGVLPWVRKHW